MASLEATGDFRISNPEGSTPQQIASDAPQLQDIAEKHPDLLIYTPSSKTYEQVRPFFNGAMTQQPLAIVRPTNDAQVAAIIRETQTKNMPFGIRSGGHDISYAQAQGKDGIIIDLRGLDSAVVAEDRASVRVGGGILGVNLSKFLHEHKLLTPHGWCATVGIAGWAMGGGYGYSSAFYGLGADQVLGARVVLASGEVVEADVDVDVDVEGEGHADLLWALRGAGNGNFGVVVELRLKVYPETGFLGGLVGFPNHQAGEVLAKFSEFEKDLPANFSGEASHMTLPGVGPVLAWLFVWTSENEDLEDGWAFHDKIKALGTPLLDTVAAVDDYSFFSSFPSFSGIHYSQRLRTIESFSPALGDIIARHPPPGPDCATVLHSAHGRAIRENPAACYPLRRRHRIVNPAAGVPDPAVQAAEFEKYRRWADDMVGELDGEKLALPYGHRNLGPERDTDWAATYGEETLAKLKEVKKRYDPENVFRTGFPRLHLL